MGSQLYLRVNGVSVEKMKVRPKMVSGAPIGSDEIVIWDPVLGMFAIDDTFVLEYTTDRRRKWKITDVQNFLAMLAPIEATG